MPESPFFSFDLGDKGGKLSFKTYDDMRLWAEKECNLWHWINPNGLDGNISEILQVGQIPFRDNLRSWIAQYPTNPAILQTIQQSIFVELLFGGRAILSTTAPGKVVLSLSEGNKVSAHWALATLTSTQKALISNQFPQAGLDGLFQAMHFRLGIKGSAASERRALEELHGEMTTMLGAKLSDFESANERFDDLIAEAQEQAKSFENTRSKAIADATATFKAELEETKSRFAALEKTFTDKMALQAPVTYWEKKARSHRTRFWILGILSVISMGASIRGITTEVATFLPKVPKGEFPDPWRIGLVLITVTMVIWVIRLLVKMTLSQLHLQTDAEERTVLANAYLALLQRDQALRPEDREMILQVLFRSAATGIVDDGGPATPIEIITKAVSNPK